ncbi:MAG: thioredoxin family protein [Betaproteobacteria bacterium]|nr:MAG: thioredoxin family protein [Betaproteobacteria bacterium]
MNVRLPIAVLMFLAALPVLAATAGQPAPNFTLTDTKGNAVQLSDFKGKYVVLEWTNPGCPFVRNHYNTRNMQSLQSEWNAKDVVWLSIDSSNQSSFDFMPPAKLGAWMQGKGAAQKAVLVDPDSTTAKLYQAKTTPHMFVIDPQGKIIYAGAIDDRPSTRPDDPPAANNYVRAALTQATGGVPVAAATTTPYGCSIKY